MNQSDLMKLDEVAEMFNKTSSDNQKKGRLPEADQARSKRGALSAC